MRRGPGAEQPFFVEYTHSLQACVLYAVQKDNVLTSDPTTARVKLQLLGNQVQIHVLQMNVIDLTVAQGVDFDAAHRICADVLQRDVLDKTNVSVDLYREANVIDRNVRKIHILDLRTAPFCVAGDVIDGCPRMLDRQARDTDVTDLARADANADSAGVCGERAVGDRYVFASLRLFQALRRTTNSNCVITRVDDAIRNGDVATAIDINAVGVAEGAGIEDLESTNRDVLATV